MNALNLALIGTGRIAEIRLAPAMAKSEAVQLWSVLSRDPERGLGFAERHGGGAAESAPASLDEYGSEGCAIADDTLTIHGAGNIRTKEGILDFARCDPYRLELEDLAAAVYDGRPPTVDVREGLRNIELLDQIG